MEGSPESASRAPLLLAVVVGVVGLVLGVFAMSQRMAVSDEHSVRGLRVLGQDVGDLAPVPTRERVATAANAFLDSPIEIKLGEVVVRSVARRQLGLRLDAEALTQRALAFGRGGDLLGRPSGSFAMFGDLVRRQRARRGDVDLEPELTLDRVVAREFLVDLKDELDRAAVDAHMDLDHHSVAPEQPGTLIKVYDALIELEYLARHGASAAGGAPHVLVLATSLVPARVTAARLAEIEIGTVLGTWETHYSSVGVDSDRTYNLKVGAEHLNGHILMPGELFSFNEVVGDRTEKEGYRVAPVIQSGELVDGIAGGMCQIASTLHAAAFFAGLEIVSSTPHSRPSSYIPMGLDSTVVYPTTDLKLRNPYEFPIVMHYNVNQGSVKVELLGKARPVRVVFEREIKSEVGFGTETRRVADAPEGQRLELQAGYPGYALVRRRFVFAENEVPRLLAKETVDQALARLKKKPLSRKEWAVRYPTTSAIVGIGSGPKTMKKKDPPPAHKIPPLRPEERGVYHLTR